MAIQIPEKNSPDSFFESLLEKSMACIGRGTSRDVYEIPEHPDKVLKVVKVPSNFANWAEIIMWSYASDKEYFAQVFSWSLSGKFLVMERLSESKVSTKEILQFKYFMNDLKVENFGRDESGSIKSLDYAIFEINTRVM